MSVPKRKSHNDVASSSARPRGRCPVSVCDATVAGSGETSVNIYVRAVPPRIRTCASATETVPFQRAWQRQGRHCRGWRTGRLVGGVPRSGTAKSRPKSWPKGRPSRFLTMHCALSRRASLHRLSSRPRGTHRRRLLAPWNLPQALSQHLSLHTASRHRLLVIWWAPLRARPRWRRRSPAGSGFISSAN